VRRVRRQKGPQIPVAPLTLFELDIPDSFKEYEVEQGVFENFLLYVILALKIIEFFYSVVQEA